MKVLRAITIAARVDMDMRLPLKLVTLGLYLAAAIWYTARLIRAVGRGL